MNPAALSKPLIFGAVDGMTCALGVVLSLHGHSAVVFPAAFGVGVAELVGMAAGEWLSESSNGLAASAAIGCATGAASILPAVPYLFTSGSTAIALSLAVLVTLAALVSLARSRERGEGRAWAETYGILAVVFTAVLLAGLIAPGGG